jgi:hypothetical protein
MSLQIWRNPILTAEEKCKPTEKGRADKSAI